MDILEEIIQMPEVGFPIKTRMFNTSCFDLSSTSHFHKEIEFIHILSGKMTFIINGRKISVSKGNILFVNSMVVHSSEGAAGDKSKMHLLQFDPGIIYSTSLFSEYKYLFPFMNHNTLACYLFNTWENKGYKLLSALLHKINMEFEGKNIAYEICIKSLLYRILTILYRNGILDFCFIKNLYYDREKFLKLKKVFEYVENHFMEDITVEKACKISNFNYHYFCRLFRNTTGKSFIEYLNFIKVSAAEKLLISTDMAVTQIIAETGFLSINYFNKVFKKLKGCSPSSYRKNFKQLASSI